MRILRAVTVIIGILAASTASAHVYQYAGTLSVLLHMEPGDNPIASEPAQLFFYFKDSTDTFRATQCDCRVSIKNDGKEIYSAMLDQPKENYGEEVRVVNYTFPDIGIYSIDLAGNSKNGSFEHFALHYDVRIDRVPEGGIKRHPNYLAWLLSGVGGILFLSGIVASFIKKQRS